MSRWLKLCRRSAPLFVSLLLFACGGATSSAGGSGGSSDAVAAGGDRTAGGRRRAFEDAECDYGGSADHTCAVGLYCCYGPPDNPGDHGSCLAECPEY